MHTKTRGSRRLGSTVGCGILALSLIAAGCSGNQESNGNGGTTQPGNTNSSAAQEVVTLSAVFPGDTPVGFDRVLGAVNEKLVTDGLGINLTIQFVPWDDYGTKTNLMTTAGDEFDMFLDAPWLHIHDMIAKGAILKLDDYIADAPNLQASIPDEMWDANRFGGDIMAIPLGTTQGYYKGFTIRKDLREKYGLPEIQTMEELETFLYQVKENDPDIMPYGVNGVAAEHQFANFSPEQYEDKPLFLPLGAGMYADPATNEVHPLYDVPGIETAFERVHQYYADGILERNILQQQNTQQLFNNGRIAAVTYDSNAVEGQKYYDVEKNVPGAEIEFVLPYQEGVKPYSDFVQANFLAIPVSSQHPEKVIELMDWLSIKENHDLLEYGIEGEDWQAIGDDQYEVINDSQYSFPGYVMTWRPTLVRTLSSMKEEDKYWFDLSRQAESFTMMPSAGFNVNVEPVRTEMAQYSAVMDSIGKPVASGVFDPAEYLPRWQQDAETAGIGRIKEVIQEQYDEFLQNQ
ncbi:ABC transporter substrate-binding protein [Paenibacillus sp. 1P07SE]|uniref:ABC transporter substrate-binding protein n=1 Tax=Paenibacillus sp. 1P07SE TaxID=3132209 RepID=UPI0039A4004E